MPLKTAYKKMEKDLEDIEPLEEEEKKTRKNTIQDEIEKDQYNQKIIQNALEERDGTKQKASLLVQSYELLKRLHGKIEQEGLKNKIEQRIQLLHSNIDIELFKRAYNRFSDGINRTKYRGTLRDLMEENSHIISYIIDFTLGNTSLTQTTQEESSGVPE
ncbi:hypothetical protein AKJ56_00410 [candidate division MSBL1 archaeon SCGC-AAA382N08]|uniref:Uncharacterized protein n=1 Tax=candidate division MSBL1 archaeon SCGC-AAA382N08 TaxID=1698285 RepID=A0A133VQS0_9EURY|nr:hypothetical protein AKJ56_00410 [candidate division MSBL1 archaeon SCGC-AAA382N08]